MTTNEKLEIVKVLLRHVGYENVETDEAICQGAIVILDSIEEPKPKAVTKDQVKKKEKSGTGSSGSEKKRIPFDTGKLGALRKAGWSVSKIADEMGVSEATVYKYMKQEGIA